MSTTARTLPSPDLGDVELTTVLFALSDPHRMDLVAELAAAGPQTVTDCQAVAGGLPKSTFSHHLKTLREAGVITNVPHGRQRMITLRRDELDDRFPGVLDSVLQARGPLTSRSAVLENLQ